MHTIALFLLTIILTSVCGHASPQPVLEKVSMSYNDNSVRIICAFNATPQYTITHTEKRIDLTLKDTVINKDIAFPATDDKMVKILSQSKKDATIISLFFRYPPHKVQPAPNQEVNKLTFDILLGNSFTTTQPELASKQPRKTVPQQKSKDLSNPLHASPYPGSWKNFFKDYEAEIQIDPTVKFSLIPFPSHRPSSPGSRKKYRHPAVRHHGERQDEPLERPDPLDR